MKELTIGEVARLSGFTASTLRYYESVGLIQPAGRVSRQRRYSPEIINRLAVIETAQQAGLSMAFIAQLLANFDGNGAPKNEEQPEGPQPARWEKLARQKIDELDRLIVQARQMQEILGQLINCECPDLNECGQQLRAQRQGPSATYGYSSHAEGRLNVLSTGKTRKQAAKA